MRGDLSAAEKYRRYLSSIDEEPSTRNLLVDLGYEHAITGCENRLPGLEEFVEPRRRPPVDR
jgi:hypothetical protein